MQNYCLYQQKLLNAAPSSAAEPSSFLILFLNHFFVGLGLETYWHKTFHGLQLQINQLLLAHEKEAALKLILNHLKNNYFWSDHSTKWWGLMRLAMNIIQGLPSCAGKSANQQLHALIKLYSHAPQPWQGDNVAYSFAALSLWCFEIGKVQKAIEYINVAIHANSQWGYPEYLLGWYGLQLKGINPIPHFARAIHQNEHFLQQLQQDPLCRYFPKLIKAVKQFLLHQPQLPARQAQGNS